MTEGSESIWIDPIEAQSNLTRSQFLIWTGQQVDPFMPLYNIVHATHLRGALDRQRFEDAFAALVEEAEALRTVITVREGVPWQEVLPDAPAQLEWLDFSHEENPHKAYEKWLRDRARRRLPMDERLIDAALLRLGEGHHVWYLNQHHVITDAWSYRILGQRMAQLYAGSEAAEPLPSYSDYVEREREARDAPGAERARRYWRQQLSMPRRRTDFYGVESRAPGPRTHRVRRDLGAERTRALKALAAEDSARLLNPELSQFRVFAALMTAFLARISGPGRLALGCPVHNRPGVTDKATPGLFIELFPLFTEAGEEDSLQAVVERLGGDIMGWLAHAQAGTSTPQSNTAFDVVLNFLTVEMPALPGLDTATDWVHSGFGDRAHALRVQVHDFDGRDAWTVDFDFNRSVFDVEREQLALRHFFTLLDAVLEDPRQPLASIDLSDPHERELQVEAFNATAVDVPANRRLYDLLAEGFTARPDACAMRCEGQAWTYAELEAMVRTQARRLGEAGVAPGQVVALMLPRGPEAVVAMLAVLALGASYLPLEVGHPDARLAAILQDAAESDAGLAAIVTPGGEAPRFEPPAPVMAVTLEAEPGEPGPSPAAGPDSIAYIIYTSGSTGAPKGVQVPHAAVVNYLCWARGQYCADRRPAVALHTSLAVDLTVTSVFLPLLAGGEVVIYPDAGPQDLPVLRVFREDAVDILKLTPAHLALLREQGGQARRISTLILGGEDLKTDLARAVLPQFPAQLALYNEYGPTEATVGCMFHRFDPERDTRASVPIGRPIANARIYCLDPDGRPAPTGIRGEICIGGAGVAAGYLNRPELNDERFVDDPFSAGVSLYRTGDIGRWLPSGELAFLGREDGQVKLRSARVELGEIEAALAEFPGVSQATARVLEPESRQRPRPCARCGMPSNYPGIVFDAEDICSLCRAWERHRDEANAFFGRPEQLGEIAAEARAAANGPHHAIVLLSGGKDSTYMLHRLVELDLKLLAVTLDNGFIAEQAMENARRSAADLGVDHVVVSTPHMNAIFSDSLARHSNVCHGCFKTIYTLALEEARKRGIRHIFTGLSRGQIFETRLDDMFRRRVFDTPEIEQAILDARKVYHRVDDAVSRLLETSMFADDALLEAVRFVDFYRYVDVSLDAVYAYLETRAPWVRPTDTGRSTNCRINDAGIFVHRRERGYHNYALPYSWDVRLGHKTREAALHELNDEIDTHEVRELLNRVGYAEKPSPDEARLVAYYVSDEAIPPTTLREHLAAHLPEEMVPLHFVHLDAMPLTSAGKVDPAALPPPGETLAPAQDYVPPATDLEHRVADVWSRLLDVARIGVHDNFFDIGGRSLTAIQVLARLRSVFDVDLPMRSFFSAPTVAELAAEIEGEMVAQIEALSDEEVERLLDAEAP